MNDKICVDFTLKDTAEFLKNKDNYIILTHASPDGDTLGAGYALYYALKQLGKTAEVVCPDLIPARYSYFLSETDHVTRENATIVAVDVADNRLLGSLQEEFGNDVDLDIDHHVSNTRFAKALLLDSDASATCEIMYELLLALDVTLNDTIAKALYTGVATDTGCFKYANVTSRTHNVAAALHSYDIDASEINRLMFDTKSKNVMRLERMVLDRAEYHFDEKCVLLTVTTSMQTKTGCSGPDMEGISIISRSIEGVMVGVTLKQSDTDSYKISMRTFDPLDASVICKALGGGGHKNAAGATMTGDLEAVKATILAAVKEQMEKTNVWSASAE